MVRRLLLSTVAAAAMIGSAAAADLPSRRPPPPAYVAPVPIFTWTGFYVGVNAGGAFRAGNNNGFNTAVFFGGAAPLALGATNNSARLIGGGQVGVNYQINQFVLGVEADGQALVGSNNNNNTFGSIGNGTTTSFLGTVRGRGGVAFDRLLVYGTAGVAFGGSNNNWPNTIVGNIAACRPSSPRTTATPSGLATQLARVSNMPWPPTGASRLSIYSPISAATTGRISLLAGLPALHSITASRTILSEPA